MYKPQNPIYIGRGRRKRKYVKTRRNKRKYRRKRQKGRGVATIAKKATKALGQSLIGNMGKILTDAKKNFNNYSVS
jgi:hypothetical protein